jgi:hypothetical protein
MCSQAEYAHLDGAERFELLITDLVHVEPEDVAARKALLEDICE